MKGKQIAVNVFAAIAVAAPMAITAAQDGAHQGERPVTSTGFVRDVR